MESAAVEFLRKSRVVAVIRSEGFGKSLELAGACADGGIKAIEVVSVSPGAREVVLELAGREGICVGAGTVMSAAAAEEFCGCGARFIVSPHTDPEIIERCRQVAVPVVQGAFTSSEMVNAGKMGADFVKIFPAASFGPGYVRAVKQALPFVDIMVTGGITADNIRDYLSAGASLAGVSTALTAAGEDYSSVRRSARRLSELAV